MKTIAIDFDGVIHKYSKGWQDGSIYDEPLEGVFEHIRFLMTEGYTVFIFSTRKPRQIKDWLVQHCYLSDCYFGTPYDPQEYTYPKYGFTIETIPWWKVIFRKNFFWNKKDVLGVTNIKIAAHAYIDDRGLKFEGDWNNTIEQIRTFKTYLQ